MQAQKVRPTGITILVILEVIFAVFLSLAGLVLVVLGPFVTEFMPSQVPDLVTGALISVFGVVLLLIGIAGFIVSWGLWTGRGWAWTLAFVLAVIGIVLGILRISQGGILDLILNGLIAWYLWRPHVKTFYHKEEVTSPYQVKDRRMPTQTQPTQPPPGTIFYCMKCGTGNSMDSIFCRNCGAAIKPPTVL